MALGTGRLGPSAPRPRQLCSQIGGWEWPSGCPKHGMAWAGHAAPIWPAASTLCLATNGLVVPGVGGHRAFQCQLLAGGTAPGPRHPLAMASSPKLVRSGRRCNVTTLSIVMTLIVV